MFVCMCGLDLKVKIFLFWLGFNMLIGFFTVLLYVEEVPCRALQSIANNLPSISFRFVVARGC